MTSVDRAPDRSLGIFTSVAIRNGTPVLLDRHLCRLEASCRDVYGLSMPDSVEDDVRTVAATSSDAQRIRVEVVPEIGELAVRIAAGPVPTDAEPLEVEVGVARQWEYGHKWIDRSQLSAVRTLFVDEADEVLELDIANVFAVVDGQVCTPPLDGRILPGVARSWVLDTADVIEEPVSLQRLLHADEVFVTNALRGVVPVRRCDRRMWAQTGPITEVLMTSWARIA